MNLFSRSALVMSALQLTLSLGVISTVFAQADSTQRAKAQISSLQKEINKLRRQVSETDSLRIIEESSHKKWIASWEEDLKKRQEELRSLNQKTNDLDKQIRDESSKQTGIENSTRELDARLKNYRAILVTACTELSAQIQNGLPWKKEERIERVNLLRRDLEQGGTGVEEGFNRLRGIYKEEIQSGDEISIHTAPMVRIDGSTVNAQILKIGHQWMVYIDEEEKIYGILQKQGNTYKWREELSFEERRAVKEAIAVKLAKKPPQLVTLPLSIAISK